VLEARAKSDFHISCQVSVFPWLIQSYTEWNDTISLTYQDTRTTAEMSTERF